MNTGGTIINLASIIVFVLAIPICVAAPTNLENDPSAQQGRLCARMEVIFGPCYCKVIGNKLEVVCNEKKVELFAKHINSLMDILNNLMNFFIDHKGSLDIRPMLRYFREVIPSAGSKRRPATTVTNTA